ncbi:MAG: Ig-like domain-containing protein, partial [Candidatus Aenigmarchaeota archaeon]|nr:Ig-like domain-containing protein [Candidatus Aenigmarchaeota archaeon]
MNYKIIAMFFIVSLVLVIPVFATDAQSSISNKIDALSFVFKLEDARMQIIGNRTVAAALVNYYTNIEKDDAKRTEAQAIYDRLGSAMTGIDAIKTRIRDNVDNFAAIKDGISQDITTMANNLVGEEPQTAEIMLSCPNGRQIGDVDGDLNINNNDALLVSRVAAGLQDPPSDICCADVDKDGKITAYDADWIQKIFVGKASSPGVCGGAPASTPTIDLATTKKQYAVGEQIKLTGDGQVNGAPTVTVTPSTESVQTGGTKTFTATVTGMTNTAVTWSVTPTGCGSINPIDVVATAVVLRTGLYKPAPSTAGTCTVTATSVVDPTKFGTATVTVTATDTTPPTVVSTSIYHGQTDVPVSTNFVITFSEPMDKTATQAAFTFNDPATSPYTRIQGSYSWSADGKTMTFTPSSLLQNDKNYRTELTTAAKDLAGNSLQLSSSPKIVSFHTAAGTPVPTITLVSPTSTVTSSSVPLSVRTTLASLCKYTEDATEKYRDMDVLTSSDGLTHTKTIPDVSSGSHTFYVQCQSLANNLIGLLTVPVTVASTSMTGNAVAKAAKDNSITGYAAGQSVAVTGILEVLHFDDFNAGTSRNEYYVNTGTERVKIEPPADMPQLMSGSTVRIQGTRVANTLSAVTSRNIQVIQSVTPGVSGEQKVLVILAKYDDDTTVFDVNQARDIVFNHVNDFYTRNSYDKIYLTGNVVGPITIAKTATTRIDDFYGFMLRALEEASKQVNLHSYQRIVIGSQFCCFAFLNKLYIPTPQGTIYASATWVGYMNYGEYTMVTHEMGHEFGLFHANRLQSCDIRNTDADANACYDVQYGDNFDTMGANNAQYLNTPHKEILGWLSSGDIITSTSGSYTLGPLETSNNKPKAVKIPIDGKSYYYYVEYRKDLSGVLIHAAPLYESGGGGGGDTHLLPIVNSQYGYDNDYILKAGQKFADKNDIQISVSNINTDSATVEISHHVQDAPDLIVDMSTAYYNRYTNLNVGEDITVNPVVTNVGLKDSSSSTLTLYLSGRCEQGIKPPVMRLLEEVPAVAIKSGESKKFDFTIPIGNYFTGFGYLVSDIESQDDYNKQNNFDCISLTVDPSGSAPGISSSTVSETVPRYVKIYFTVRDVQDYEGFELWRADGSDNNHASYQLIKSVGVTGIVIDDIVNTNSYYIYKMRAFKTTNGNKVYSDFGSIDSVYISPVIPSFAFSLTEYTIFTADNWDIVFNKIKIMAIDGDAEIKDIQVSSDFQDPQSSGVPLLNLRAYDGDNEIGKIDRVESFGQSQDIILNNSLIIKAGTSRVISFVADIDSDNYNSARLRVNSFNGKSGSRFTFNLPIYGYFI